MARYVEWDKKEESKEHMRKTKAAAAAAGEERQRLENGFDQSNKDKSKENFHQFKVYGKAFGYLLIVYEQTSECPFN
ncbi:hypothetical protein RUM43_002051 [Polyplax serrata]|uniref:Uncharacterized protein n=1 Tax=Polyplax serrata TaxID=468196 RepID=A0AAN8S5Q5_POLSC